MADLTTNYLGLDLNNPIIVGSCSLTSKIEDIIQLHDSGAAAVVLNSIFEEEIMQEMGIEYELTNRRQASHSHLAETLNYISTHTHGHRLEDYLKLIKKCKSKINIPVIASVNCITDNGWIDTIRELELAGADALELNMFINPLHNDFKDVEHAILSIIKKVLKKLTIPVSVKLSDCYTNLSEIIEKISTSGVAGMVLFNRHHMPDIDIYNLNIISGKMHSWECDYTKSLRWIALKSPNIACSLAACTGIHQANTIIKQILAGADAVQIVTAVYLKGKSYIKQMLDEIDKWMLDKGIFSLQEIKGRASYKETIEPAVYERIQFMKYYGRIN